MQMKSKTYPVLKKEKCGQGQQYSKAKRGIGQLTVGMSARFFFICSKQTFN